MLLREASYLRVWFTSKFVIIPIGMIIIKPFIHLLTLIYKLWFAGLIFSLFFFLIHLKWRELAWLYLYIYFTTSIDHICKHIACLYLYLCTLSEQIWCQWSQRIVACRLLPSDCKQINFMLSACFGKRYSCWILFLWC